MISAYNISALTSDVNATTTISYSYLYPASDASNGTNSTAFGNNSSYNGTIIEYGSSVFPSYIRTTSMKNDDEEQNRDTDSDSLNEASENAESHNAEDEENENAESHNAEDEKSENAESQNAEDVESKAVPFVELTVAHASVLTILAISFERYYAICKPLKAGYICTKARASLICLLAWFIAAVFTSPILGIAEFKLVDYFDGTKVTACHTLANTFWSALYFLSSIFLFFIVPLVVLLVLYCIIAKNLIYNAASLVLNKHIDNYSMRARRQVILMLGTVVLSFFLCLIPFRVFTLWIIIVPEESVMNLGMERYYNILYFCRIMVYLNSAVNPILYNLMSSKFRTGFVICSETRRKLFSGSGQHSSSRSSTFRTSHEGYRVCYRPKNCSVLIKTSTDSSDTRSLDSNKGKSVACVHEECSRVNVNIFTDRVIICHKQANNGGNPILAITQYGPEEYFDGSLVFVCFSMVVDIMPCIFFIGSVVIFFIFPLAILICVYALIARTLMAHPTNLVALNNKSISIPNQSVIKYRKQVMMMLGTVVIAFFVCLLPFRALTLWIIISPPGTSFQIGFETYYNILYFSRIMFHINSAVNPILYNIMSSKFRGGFFKLCGIRNLRRQFRKTEIIRKSTTSSTTPSTQPTSESGLRSLRAQSSLREVKEKPKLEELSAEQTKKSTLTKNVYIRAPLQIVGSVAGQKISTGAEIYV
ncbi:unnamed protein product [Ceutorhynchus assimilis]|uniref:G-protein coupled receptors family 1 profile domain-containing protein n=1 Tax=Ceutorhynchus assimilis TaxID=467358 RepID=A0A9N9MZ68_9CUCU|nr:unnamed protein product [Ceutorhynchus assimilis]